VFIIGSDKFDSVGDSYRRTLAPYYDVQLFNPDELIPSRYLPWGRARPTLLTAALSLSSRLLLGHPMAVSLPRLLRAARDFAPDIILVPLIHAVPEATIRQLRKDTPGVKIVGVFSDALSNFERGYFFLAEYDALFFKDHFIVDKLRSKLGWKHVFYLPQACDPVLHHPVELTAEDRAAFGCDLTLAGNVHTFRAAQLTPLIGRNLRIWGNAVPRWLDHPIRQHCEPRYVAGEDKCKAMLAAKIVLNANHYAEIDGTNKRTFEVAAIGAFQLTDTPALADVFDPETEVPTFGSQADMLEKIDYYLAHPERRTEMARRACERAHREHTYAHRWTAKMAVLGCALPPEFPVQPHQVVCRAV
jgi:spore maturation protein CgeB